MGKGKRASWGEEIENEGKKGIIYGGMILKDMGG